MHLHITDRYSIPLFAHREISHIISIGDREDIPPINQFFRTNVSIYRFVFDDISHEAENGPQRHHVERMIRVFRGILAEGPDSRLLFHCAAGISRSTAAAFIFLVLAGLNYQDAYQAAQTARGNHINPNELMARYADEILGHDGQLAAFIKSRHIG